MGGGAPGPVRGGADAGGGVAGGAAPRAAADGDGDGGGDVRRPARRPRQAAHRGLPPRSKTSHPKFLTSLFSLVDRLIYIGLFVVEIDQIFRRGFMFRDFLFFGY